MIAIIFLLCCGDKQATVQDAVVQDKPVDTVVQEKSVEDTVVEEKAVEDTVVQDKPTENTEKIIQLPPQE